MGFDPMMKMIPLLGLLLFTTGCEGLPHRDRTYRYDRSGIARGYYYPKNDYYKTYLRRPNIDNRKRCPKSRKANHSCKRR
jgi:hypothetical protein